MAGPGADAVRATPAAAGAPSPRPPAPRDIDIVIVSDIVVVSDIDIVSDLGIPLDSPPNDRPERRMIAGSVGRRRSSAAKPFDAAVRDRSP
jgi:hypothetical protein